MRPLTPVLMARMKSGMADRLDIAGALQRRLAGIHRVRDIDGEHQLQIDRAAGRRHIGAGGERRRETGKQGNGAKCGFHEKDSRHSQRSEHSQVQGSATIEAN